MTRSWVILTLILAGVRMTQGKTEEYDNLYTKVMDIPNGVVKYDSIRSVELMANSVCSYNNMTIAATYNCPNTVSICPGQQLIVNSCASYATTGKGFLYATFSNNPSFSSNVGYVAGGCTDPNALGGVYGIVTSSSASCEIWYIQLTCYNSGSYCSGSLNLAIQNVKYIPQSTEKYSYTKTNVVPTGSNQFVGYFFISQVSMGIDQTLVVNNCYQIGNTNYYEGIYLSDTSGADVSYGEGGCYGNNNFGVSVYFRNLQSSSQVWNIYYYCYLNSPTSCSGTFNISIVNYAPTSLPTEAPTVRPSEIPSAKPTSLFSSSPSVRPTSEPSVNPSQSPSSLPTLRPSLLPSAIPTKIPSSEPTIGPSANPSGVPSINPSSSPSTVPTTSPSAVPTYIPTARPSASPTSLPTINVCSFTNLAATSAGTTQLCAMPAYICPNQEIYINSCASSTSGGSGYLYVTFSASTAFSTNTGYLAGGCTDPSYPSGISGIIKSESSACENWYAKVQCFGSFSYCSGSINIWVRDNVYNVISSTTYSITKTNVVPSGKNSFVGYYDVTLVSLSPGQIVSITDCGNIYNTNAYQGIFLSDSSANYVGYGEGGCYGNNNYGVSLYFQNTLTTSQTWQVKYYCYINSPTSCSGDFTVSKMQNNPTAAPSAFPTVEPTANPSMVPTSNPTMLPTRIPTIRPSTVPTIQPTLSPSAVGTNSPTFLPTINPSSRPSAIPTLNPSNNPSGVPTQSPTAKPSVPPTAAPSSVPSILPSASPSKLPTPNPTSIPTTQPSAKPTISPSSMPTVFPTSQPTINICTFSNLDAPTESVYTCSIPAYICPGQQLVINSCGDSTTSGSGTLYAYISTSLSFSTKSGYLSGGCTDTSSPSGIYGAVTSSSSSCENWYVLMKCTGSSSFCSGSATINVESSSYASVASNTYTFNKTNLVPFGKNNFVGYYYISQVSVGVGQILKISDCGLIGSTNAYQGIYLSDSSGTDVSFSEGGCYGNNNLGVSSYFKNIESSTQTWNVYYYCYLNSPTSCSGVFTVSVVNIAPSAAPTKFPSSQPSSNPTITPSNSPSRLPSIAPSFRPTLHPTSLPTKFPTVYPSSLPSRVPTAKPTSQPSAPPSLAPTRLPTTSPTMTTCSFSDIPATAEGTRAVCSTASLYICPKQSFAVNSCASPTATGSGELSVYFNNLNTDANVGYISGGCTDPTLSSGVYGSITSSASSCETWYVSVLCTGTDSFCSGTLEMGVQSNAYLTLSSTSVTVSSYSTPTGSTYTSYYIAKITVNSGATLLVSDCNNIGSTQYSQGLIVGNYYYPFNSVSYGRGGCYGENNLGVSSYFRNTQSTIQVWSIYYFCYVESASQCGGTFQLSVLASAPTPVPTYAPTLRPSAIITAVPSRSPTRNPSARPSRKPSASPSSPSKFPSPDPSFRPSANPSPVPSKFPRAEPTVKPTQGQPPTIKPSTVPTESPTNVRISYTYSLSNGATRKYPNSSEPSMLICKGQTLYFSNCDSLTAIGDESISIANGAAVSMSILSQPCPNLYGRKGYVVSPSTTCELWYIYIYCGSSGCAGTMFVSVGTSPTIVSTGSTSTTSSSDSTTTFAIVGSVLGFAVLLLAFLEYACKIHEYITKCCKEGDGFSPVSQT